MFINLFFFYCLIFFEIFYLQKDDTIKQNIELFLQQLFDRKSKIFKDMFFQNNLVNSFININKVQKLLNQKKLFNAEAKFIFCILNLAILVSNK